VKSTLDDDGLTFSKKKTGCTGNAAM